MSYKVTRSLNLISYLRTHDVNVDVDYAAGKIFGTYETTDDVEAIKEQYRGDIWLHRYLNEFAKIREEAMSKCEY